MKRDFLSSVSFKGGAAWQKVLRMALKWLAAAVIANAVMLIFMMILTVIQKKWRLEDATLRLILTVLITISAGLCAYLYTRLSKLKGYVCGLITAAIYGVIKVIMSAVSGGITGSNSMIYVCMICAALIGGILSANKRRKKKDDVGKIYKFAKMK